MIHHRTKGVSILLSLGFILTAFFLIVMIRPTSAAINPEINFQGKLTNADGTNVTNGTYNLQFKIYSGGDGVVGGGDETLQWTEERLRNNSQGVTVTDGIFQIRLGSVTTLPGSIDFNTSTLWLSVNIGNTNATCTPFSACSGDGEMSPMVRFTSAPYAFNSDALDGLDSASFVKLAQGLQTDTSTANPSIYVNKNNSSGTPNILQLQKASSDVFVINNTGNITATGTYNSNTFSSSTLQFGAGGTATVDSASGQALQIGTGANAHNITVGNTTTTSSLTLQSGSGGINLSPATTGNVVLSEAAGSQLQVTATAASTVDLIAVTNSGQASTTSGVDGILLTFGSSNASGDALHFAPSYAGGATDTLTYNVLEVDAFSPTNGAGTDTVNGLKFGNLTDPGATITSSGLNVGTGWDNDIKFNDTSVTVQTPTSGANAVSTLSINNAAGTNLFQLRDLTGNSTQFGSIALADAFIGRQSYFAEEFNVIKGVAGTGCADLPTATTINTAQRRGDTGNPGTACGAAGTGELSTSSAASGSNNGETCTYASQSVVNGVERVGSVGTASRTAMCFETTGTTVATTQNQLFNSANFPQIIMKVKPSNIGNSTQAVFAGISNKQVLPNSAAGMAAVDKGYYFSNCTNPISGALACVGTGWNGFVADGTTSPPDKVACPATAISTTVYSYLRIEIRKASAASTAQEVEFFVDYDTTNGISETSCGTITTTTANMGASVGMGMLLASYSGNTTAENLDVDYFRVWQDDSPTSTTTAPLALNSTNETQAQDSAKTVLSDIMTQTDPDAVAANTTNTLDLTVPGSLTAQGGLIVGGAAEFHGNSIFYKLASFVERVVFHNDVNFEGRVTFNNDSGGFATIKTGQKQVHVSFAKPFESPPIVTVNVKNGIFITYSYKELDKNGFTIILPQAAQNDTDFAWTALAVQDPKTTTGQP